MTAGELADLQDPAVLILPTASTEQHGRHLPTGTDSFILQGILQAAGRQAGPTRAVALPLQSVGWSTEHCNLPGTLSLDAELLAAAWVGLGTSVAQAGLRRLLILNSHGGNPPAIELAAMRLRARSGMLVAQAHWEVLARPAELAPPDAPARDWHAGWIETSLMLHLRPELVTLDQLMVGDMRFPDGMPPDGAARWAWMTTDLSPNGVIGDPTIASADLGARLLERAVAGLAAIIDRMAAAPWPPLPETSSVSPLPGP
jgi:creatinine amidohydrolase